MTELGFGQEIIFDEIQELNNLLKTTRKKNWTEIFKAKIINLAYDKVISFKGAKIAYQLITGDDIGQLLE